jgi:hypothetical protein
VGKINFLRDTAKIKIYYDDPQKVGRNFTWLDTELDSLEDAHYS